MALRLFPNLWLLAAVAGAAKTPALDELIAAHYPTQYVVRKLEAGQRISVDGVLDEAAWADVPWLDNFLDLAGPRYQGVSSTSWQEASRYYARRLTGEENPTRVKMRWDEQFLYVAAELRSRHVAASVSGHCDELESDTWTGMPVLPYFDDDFEVFIDASQDNYFYVEYEVNARNATYDTLWTLPQAGLGSVAPECGGGASARKVCCNTTWNRGRGLCDSGPETEARAWTMEMYDAAKRPGTGMHSATKNSSGGWALEVRFPILSTDDHGGLINLQPGAHYPGADPERLHPGRGQRFWWGTFANAMHAPWWSRLNATATRQPQAVKALCEEVIDSDTRHHGYTQFLVDANNAAPTCYYEAASQHLGGHQYMHNPDGFGYLQFAPRAQEPCRNVQWLARFVLAQIYQAEVQYLAGPHLGNGTYTANLTKLLSPSVCTISNACNTTALAEALEHVDVDVAADEGAHTGSCARYAVGASQTSNWTGGPCFHATVAYTIQRREGHSKEFRVAGSINEARYIHFDTAIGQRWDEADSAWLCLDDVLIRPRSLVYV